MNRVTRGCLLRSHTAGTRYLTHLCECLITVKDSHTKAYLAVSFDMLSSTNTVWMSKKGHATISVRTSFYLLLININ